MIKHYPKSSAWLYFGCRDVTENMFSDETSKFVQRRVAFSRIDRDRKEYVQDLIEQDCAQVYDLISNHQAHIYICGKVIVQSNLVIRNFLVTAKLFLLMSNVPYCQLFTISEINRSLF